MHGSVSKKVNGCGVVRSVRSMVSYAYDRVAEEWDRLYTDPRAFAEDRWTFAQIEKFGADRGRVLDLGCGTGLALRYLRVSPARYLGVDISRGMLDVAKKNFPKYRFEYGDMQATELQSASFDSVISTYAAFSYVQDRVGTAKEMYRLLDWGGRVFVMVYGPKCQARNYYARVGMDGKQVPRHFFRSEELRRIFCEAGFRDVRVRGLTAFCDDVLGPRTPQSVADALVAVEAAVVGRVVPDSCVFLLVTGVK